MRRSCARIVPLRLLSRDELAQYVAHRCAVAGAARAPFDDRALEAIFEIGRGNLRPTDDLAFKSLDYAAAGGHASLSSMSSPRARTSGRDVRPPDGPLAGALRSARRAAARPTPSAR